ncbi:hypothetical protein RQV60_003576 [Vibrio cholerae]|nr:hypothetical protein [Vibrio cholerae]
MKQLLDSIRDNALTRIKNPLIGAFLFSWLALNIKGVSLFLLSSIPEKRLIIGNWSPNLYDDLFLPIILTVFYLGIVPWIHLLYQAFDEGVISQRRQNIKNQTLLAYYKGLREINERKTEADEDYIASLKQKNVLNWPDEKKRISAIAMENRKQLAKKINDMAAIEEKVVPALEGHNLTRQHLFEYIESLSKVERLLNESNMALDHLTGELAQQLKLIRTDLRTILKHNTCPNSLITYYKKDSIERLHETELNT